MPIIDHTAHSLEVLNARREILAKIEEVIKRLAVLEEKFKVK